MTGLMFKDLVVTKRQHMIFAIVCLVMFVIGILQKDFLLFFSLLAVISLLEPYTAIAYDEISKFDKFAITMPVKKGEIILAKYLYCLLFVFLYMVFAFSLASVNGNFVKDLKVFMLIISTTLIVFSLSCPIIYKYGIRYGQIIIFAFIFIGSSIAGFGFGKIEENTNVLKILEIVFPCVAIISFVLSYFLTNYIYKNKNIE